MNRRLVSLGVLVAAAALSSCNAAGGDGDVVATVDGHELTADELNVLTEGSTDGPTVRSALTAWTRVAAVSAEMQEIRSLDDLDAAREQALQVAMVEVGDAPRNDYELGLGGSSYLCLAVITLGTEIPGADVVAELRDGLSFADAAVQYSTNERLKSTGGVLSNEQGDTCLDNEAFEQSFPGIIAVLNDAQATVGNPVVVSDSSGDLVLLLRGYDDLNADEQRVIAQVELSAVLGADLDEADVRISSRYGKWDATSREVVGTSEG